MQFFFTVLWLSFSNCESLEKYLKQDVQAATVNLLAVHKLTCKTIYLSLINHQHFCRPTAEKRKLTECGFDIHKDRKYIRYPFL